MSAGESFGMAAVVLATGLALAAVIWAVGSLTRRSDSGIHRMPEVKLPPGYVPPSAAVWTTKTKTTRPAHSDGSEGA